MDDNNKVLNDLFFALLNATNDYLSDGTSAKRDNLLRITGALNYVVQLSSPVNPDGTTKTQYVIKEVREDE